MQLQQIVVARRRWECYSLLTIAVCCKPTTGKQSVDVIGTQRFEQCRLLAVTILHGVVYVM